MYQSNSIARRRRCGGHPRARPRRGAQLIRTSLETGAGQRGIGFLLFKLVVGTRRACIAPPNRSSAASQDLDAVCHAALRRHGGFRRNLVSGCTGTCSTPGHILSSTQSSQTIASSEWAVCCPHLSRPANFARHMKERRLTVTAQSHLQKWLKKTRTLTMCAANSSTQRTNRQQTGGRDNRYVKELSVVRGLDCTLTW